jgi:hypothetical protein
MTMGKPDQLKVLVVDDEANIRETPLLALLLAKQRELMEDLENAGVDFVKLMAEETLSSSLIIEIINGLSPGDRVEQHMQRVCTYLHYEGIDTRQEIKVCGAYLDRMVPGGKDLHEICHTDKHLRCEYFLNPRVRS